MNQVIRNAMALFDAHVSIDHLLSAGLYALRHMEHCYCISKSLLIDSKVLQIPIQKIWEKVLIDIQANECPFIQYHPFCFI